MCENNSLVPISIVTVVKNAVGELEKTFESILFQNANIFEWVIIDGMSDDGTQDLLLTIENSSVTVKHISEKDDNLYDAMNKGALHASGSFLAFINAGDTFVDENVLEDVANFLHTDRGCLYFGNTVLKYKEKYSNAPPMHHQSVFFPASFFQGCQYNSAKFHIAAETHLIELAKKNLECIFIDRNIVYSELVGLRISCFKSIRGSVNLYREMTDIYAEVNQGKNRAQNASYFLKCIVKYLAYKIGGMELLSKLVLLNAINVDRKSSTNG